MRLAKEKQVLKVRPPKETFRDIDTSIIQDNPYQPRAKIEPKALRDLAASIEKDGLQNPIVVFNRGLNYFLISGKRRLEAFRILSKRNKKYARIPCSVKTGLTNQMILELSLIENLKREDLDAVEKAKSYRVLQEKFHYSVRKLSSLFERSIGSVHEYLQLAKLSLKEQEMARKEGIRKVIAISKVKEKKHRAKLRKKLPGVTTSEIQAEIKRQLIKVPGFPSASRLVKKEDILSLTVSAETKQLLLKKLKKIINLLQRARIRG